MTEIYTPAENGDPQNTQGTPPTNDIQLPDEVLALIGEGKKYATLADAIKALPHAQSHIATLEAEQRALREAQGKSLSQEEVYAAVQDFLKQNPQTTGTAIDEKVLDTLLDRKLKEQQSQATVQANVTSFKSAMGKFGDDKAQAKVFNEKAEELGMTPEALGNMVGQSPKAALKLFGLEGAKPTPRSSTQDGVNTQALSQHQGAPPKTKLVGRSSRDLQAEWRQTAEAIQKKYGV